MFRWIGKCLCFCSIAKFKVSYFFNLICQKKLTFNDKIARISKYAAFKKRYKMLNNCLFSILHNLVKFYLNRMINREECLLVGVPRYGGELRIKYYKVRGCTNDHFCKLIPKEFSPPKIEVSKDVLYFSI